ncbi:MAG: dipeptidase [Anaerolineae bacterium]
MKKIIIDGHLDLAYNGVVLGRDVRRPVEEIRAAEKLAPPPGVHTGTCLVSIPTLLKGRIAVIGGSLFVAPAWKRWQNEAQVYHNAEEAHEQALTQLDFYRRLDDEDDRVRLVGNADVLDEILGSWKTENPVLGIFVVMEGADPIRHPDEVGWWVERGLRGIGPTWAAGTLYSGGNAEPGPLTDEGQALLKTMADFNLLLDISHMWEEAAHTALNAYPGPIVATHANPRAFVDSPRMLSDDLIQHLIERRGVMGIVPFNRMLEPGWSESDPRLPLRRVVEAIDYVCQLAGSAEHVAIGSDFDGGLGRESIPAEMDSVADLNKIGDLLRERGYAERDVDAIMSENWLGIFRETLAGF